MTRCIMIALSAVLALAAPTLAQARGGSHGGSSHIFSSQGSSSLLTSSKISSHEGHGKFRRHKIFSHRHHRHHCSALQRHRLGGSCYVINI